MKATRTTELLFVEEPLTWGLRGDPYLWRAMAVQLANAPWPDSLEQLDAMLTQAFEQLTGRGLDAQGHFFVEAFAHGGMSSGGISPQFWRDQGLPLLRKRWAGA